MIMMLHDDVVVNMLLRLILTHVKFIETRGPVSLPWNKQAWLHPESLDSKPSNEA